jgi:hypothetical protein
MKKLARLARNADLDPRHVAEDILGLALLCAMIAGGFAATSLL